MTQQIYDRLWVQNTSSTFPALQVRSGTADGSSTIIGTLTVSHLSTTGTVTAGIMSATGLGLSAPGVLVVDGPATFSGSTNFNSPGTFTTAVLASVINGSPSLFISGLVFTAGAVAGGSIVDYTGSTWAHYIAGNKYWGIDSTGAAYKAGGSAVRMGSLSYPWAASTAYTVGQRRGNGINLYRVTTAGTSAGSGGPTGTGSSITDGSVVWTYDGLVSQQRIVAFDPQQTADVQLLAYVNPGTSSTSGTLYLGSAGAGSVQVATSILPSANNTLGLGASGNVFRDLWVTNINGTIYTPSSPSLKTEIADMPEMLPLVMSIVPKTYKWAAGRVEIAEVETVTTGLVFEETRQTEELIELRDGVATRVEREVPKTVPIFDDVPVFDENGAPVIITGEGSEAEYGPDGSLICDASPAVSRQLTHRVMRTAQRNVATRQGQVVPDDRTHFGFLAPDVKAAFDAAGINYGGYLKNPDGTEGLRPDAQLAVLWQAVRELAARVQFLEGRST